MVSSDLDHLGMTKSTRERLSIGADRLFDRLRHPDALAVRSDDGEAGDFGVLEGFPYAVLVTYRRNGDAVPTPVWFALDASGSVFVKTRHEAGKVKRVRQCSDVLLAGSTARGRPRTSLIRGHARVLDRDGWGRAEAALSGSYGLGRRVSEAMLGGADVPAYLEIRPLSAP